MAVIRSSRCLSPFIFSNFNRYYILVFFGLAILGPFIDGNLGLDFLSNNSITIRLAYPLALLYFFWSAVDTFIWIVGKPNEFLEIAKRKRSRKKGNPLSRNPSNIFFYYFYAIFMLLLGAIVLVGTIKTFMS